MSEGKEFHKELSDEKDAVKEVYEETFISKAAGRLFYFLRSSETNFSFALRELAEEFPEIFPNHKTVESIAVQTRQNYNRAIIEALYLLLGKQNLAGNLQNSEYGALFQGFEGEIVLENDSVKCQVDDSGRILESNETIRKTYGYLLDEMKSFKLAGSLFKIYITITDDALVARMDPGSHKEFLGIIPPHGDHNGLVVHRHNKSSFEYDRRAADRAQYIEKVLQETCGRNIYTLSKPEDRAMTNIISLSVDDPRDTEKKIRSVMRLCHSVKDLDMELRNQGDIRFAVQLFLQGVTNIKNFLMATERYRPRSRKTREDAKETVALESKLLNGQEISILEDFKNRMREREEFINHLKSHIEVLRSAKELNYRILDFLVKFLDQGRAAYNLANEQPVGQEEFVRARGYRLSEFYNKIIFQLKEMGECVDIWRGQIVANDNRVDVLAKRFDESVLMLDAAREDAQVTGLDQYFQNFLKIFDDKGGMLKTWDDVDTLHEAVRFLHEKLYEKGLSGIILSELNSFTSRNDLDQTYFAESGDMPIIDVSEAGAKKSAAGSVFYDAIALLSNELKNKVYVPSTSQKPFILIGDDFMEFSFPGGKHRIDGSAQAKSTQPEEYSVSIQYYESNYPEAGARLQFMYDVLKNTGFTFTSFKPGDNGYLSGYQKTEDKTSWKRDFSTVVRLCHSLSNLDLMSGWTNNYARLVFSCGATNLEVIGPNFVNLLFSDKTSEDKAKAMRRIFLFGGKGEKKSAMALALQKGRKNKEIKNLFAELREEDMKDVFSAVDFLIDDAYRAGDENEMRRLKKKYHLISEFEKS